VNNTSYSRGGGIDLSGGNSLCILNTFKNNNSGEGGGLSCYLSDSRIINNLFSDNAAQLGGALMNIGSSPVIVNNTIVDNQAYVNGGGIYNRMESIGVQVYSNPQIINTILFSNEAQQGFEIYSNAGNMPVISYSDIEELSSLGIHGDYNDLGGNIEDDPVFISPASLDYALSQSSPCIDMGDTDIENLFLDPVDLNQNIRVWDGNNDGSAIIDMGAYEFGAPPAGIFDYEALSKVNSIQISPNPCTDVVEISFELSEVAHISITVYNTYGKLIKSHNLGKIKQGKHKFSYHMKELESGMYLIEISADQSGKSSKIIKTDH